MVKVVKNCQSGNIFQSCQKMSKLSKHVRSVFWSMNACLHLQLLQNPDSGFPTQGVPILGQALGGATNVGNCQSNHSLLTDLHQNIYNVDSTSLYYLVMLKMTGFCSAPKPVGRRSRKPGVDRKPRFLSSIRYLYDS